MTPFDHACSSALKFGGVAEDYIRLHSLIDSSKVSWPNANHRIMLHHSAGIEVMVRTFGEAMKNSDGIFVPTRLLCEEHIKEDLGSVPTLQELVLSIANNERRLLGGGFGIRETEDVRTLYTKYIRSREG